MTTRALDVFELKAKTPGPWGKTMVEIALEVAKQRHPWVSCPKCGDWGLPLPTKTQIKKSPTSKSILAPQDWRNYKKSTGDDELIPGSFCASSVSFSKKLSDQLIGMNLLFHWLSWIIPFSHSDNRRFIVETMGDSIDTFPISDGSFFFITPRKALLLDSTSLLVGCEVCGKNPCWSKDVLALNDLRRNSSGIFYKDKSGVIVVNERAKMEITNGKIRNIGADLVPS